MIVIKQFTPKVKKWCKRHGYDWMKINRERYRNRVVVLCCEAAYEARIWGIPEDEECPIIIYNPDGVWLNEGRDPYTE